MPPTKLELARSTGPVSSQSSRSSASWPKAWRNSRRAKWAPRQTCSPIPNPISGWPPSRLQHGSVTGGWTDRPAQVLEPRMPTAVDLHEFTGACPALARLVASPHTSDSGQPNLGLNHPRAYPLMDEEFMPWVGDDQRVSHSGGKTVTDCRLIANLAIRIARATFGEYGIALVAHELRIACGSRELFAFNEPGPGNALSARRSVGRFRSHSRLE